jgi:hypothetical protein
MNFNFFLLVLIFCIGSCGKIRLISRSDISNLDGKWVCYAHTDSNGAVIQADPSIIGVSNYFGVYCGGMLVSNKGCNFNPSFWTDPNYLTFESKPILGALAFDLKKQTFTLSKGEFQAANEYEIIKFSAKDIWYRIINDSYKQIYKIKKID